MYARKAITKTWLKSDQPRIKVLYNMIYEISNGKNHFLNKVSGNYISENLDEIEKVYSLKCPSFI